MGKCFKGRNNFNRNKIQRMVKTGIVEYATASVFVSMKTIGVPKKRFWNQSFGKGVGKGPEDGSVPLSN